MNFMKPLLAASLAGLISTAAFAQTPQQNTGSSNAPSFTDLDKNGDGAISSEEAQGTWLASAFQRVDANGDGYVTRLEYEEAVK